LLNDEETVELLRYIEILGPEIEKDDTEAEAERLRASFKYFMLRAWEHVESRRLVMGWHIEMMCDYLQALEERRYIDALGCEVASLLINVPPGFSKSVCVCVLWPAWVWMRSPAATFFGASYSDKLSIRDSQKTRRLMRSDWYQRYSDARIVVDKNEYFSLSTGGWRWASTPGGFATGEHFDHLIVDDPNNARKAESRAEREAVNEWWDLTMSTRGVGLGRVTAGVMQRFHVSDWAGHFLATTPGVLHLVLPMEYETKRDGTPRNQDVGLGQDPRKVAGELLDPIRYPKPVVEALKRSLGIYGSSGQLQQRPTSREGAVFKTDRLSFCEPEQVPSGLKLLVRGWDRAGTKGSGDYSAGVLMGLYESVDGVTTKVYVIDVIHGRWTAGKVQQLIELYCTLDEAKYGMGRMLTAIEQEPAASGKLVAEITMQKLAGHRVRCIKPTGNKQARAESFANSIEAFEVVIVRGPWNKDYIDELAAFPRGDHDDQVDASSLAYLELVNPARYDLPDPDDDEKGFSRAACANNLCDRLVEIGSSYCCGCCENMHGYGETDHSETCTARHASLYRKELWTPNSRV
jgi:predicted phage terminase large subunit-like protein